MTYPATIGVDDAPNLSTRCECGNRKASSAFACSRCTYLDGTKLAALAIEALRDSHGMSLRDLAMEIFGKADKHNEQRSLLRTMQVLERAGRVRRYRDDVAVESNAFGLYDARRHSYCWVYKLSARSEASR